MTPSESELAASDLERQREDLRRNFVRANTAVAVILIALLALAAAAVVASFRAGRDQELAQAASGERQDQLAHALLAQARAVRLSGRAGRRFEALRAISNAAALGPTTELRGEAIACLALTDLTAERLWPQSGNPLAFAFDKALERYAVSSDGRRLTIVGPASNTLPLQLDLASVPVDANRGFMGLTFSPRGRYLATRLYGGGAVVWETASGKVAFAYATNGAFETGGMPSFSQDEHWFVFAEAQQATNLMRVDLNSGAVEPLPVTVAPWRLFQVHPDGRSVAVGNREALELWDLETGQLTRRLEFTSRIAALAWDDSGRKLAAGCANGDIHIWEVPSGTERQLVGHTAVVLMIQFSPDGELLCTSGWDGTARLWEVTSGRALLTMEGQALEFSADGQHLGFYQRGTGLGVWRLSPGVGHQVLRPVGGRPGEGWKTDLSPDGRWLALAKKDVLHVWDLNSTKPSLAMPIANLYTVFWHPHEPTLFLMVNGQIETCAVAPAPPEAAAAVQLGPRSVLDLPPGLHPVMAALSGNGRTLALVDSDGLLQIGELNRTDPFVRVAPRANPTGPLGSGSLTGSGRLAVSPDGQWVATVDMATSAAPHVFEASNGRLVKVLPTATAAVGFSPDGRWLATCGKEEFALWSVSDWSQIWRRPRGGLPSVEGGIAFSADGSVLAVTQSHEVVGLLDRATGDELAAFTPPGSPAHAGILMSADARRMVVSTLNDTIQVWEVNLLRRELASLGLDWGRAAAPPARVNPRPAWASPAGAILFGLACVAPTAFFALWALRRHRGLLQQFVQSEAQAQRRNRELEVAKVELMHSQKMNALGTLAAGIAHDFNNLLSVIRMSNKLIGRATQPSADVAEEVANIEEAVQQGKQVVGSMLGFSREQAGDNGACDLEEVVEETVSLLSKEFLSGIELTLTLDRHAPPAAVGRGRLGQILLNLVVNAAEAMKGRGKLKIGVQARAPELHGNFVRHPRPAVRYVELTVTDSGPGIAPDVLPRIFEPFFTTKTTGVRQGTGLGLSMVYTIAEQEGLGLAVETAPDRGTTFLVLVPCAPDAQFPTAAPPDK